MTCQELRALLPGFHLDALDPEDRAAVEAHLVTCHDCVGAFIAVKRAIEHAEHAPRPAPRVRARLREAMTARLNPRARRAWWERPLAFGVAAASVLLALGAVQRLARDVGAAPYASVALDRPPR